jgi:outer membrane receptor protein involved in Fe transport
VAVLSLAFGSVAFAEPREFNLPAEDAVESIPEFARQAGLQIVAPARDLRGWRTPPVHGVMEPRAALELLLEGTGLEVAADDGRVITLRRESQGDQALPAQIDAAAQPTEPDIIVVGSNIRGQVNPTAPVIIIDREDIDASGVSTATQLLEKLPQNFSLASQSAVNVPGVAAAQEQGAAINLRGIGEGTTLVLLNGRRVALGYQGSSVDIASLPLSAVERVEVLTDGASAVYGSDAVGGVVNFVLRDDFEGGETRARVGHADGVDEYRVSQAVGAAWDSGNIVASAEYYSRDLLAAADRDFVPANNQIGSLAPEDENISVFVSGRQELAANLTFSADALYANRDSYNEGGSFLQDENYTTDNVQWNVGGSLRWDLAGEWGLEGTALFGRNELDLLSRSTLFGGLDLFSDTVYDVSGFGVKADGPLAALPGGTLRVAFGADWREESFESRSVLTGGFFAGEPVSAEQDVASGFIEFAAPLIGPENAIPGVRRLELSLAGRYDEYSNFGSSFDPRYGVMWEPAEGLRLRASYGTSYVAPRLIDYNIGGANQALALVMPDPGLGGTSTQLLVLGFDDDLRPQEAETISIGVEFAPASIEGLRASVNYFNIEYTNRIANTDASTVMLANPDAWGDLIIRDPTDDEVNAYIAIGQQGVLGFRNFLGVPFTPDMIDVIIDMRRRNLSETTTEGFDFAIDYGFDTRLGDVSLGLTGTHIAELVRKATQTSEPSDAVSTFFNPPDWRLRGNLGVREGAVSFNAFVNYTDGYTDNRVLPTRAMASYTTIDTRFAYDFGYEDRSGLFSGVTLALSVLNLFDQDPPNAVVVQTSRDMGFDPTNANPMGRMAAIELTKRW